MDAETRRSAQGLARAAGGAIIFALPLVMTAEMWSLGFAIDRVRLLILLLLLLPTLVVLSYHAGYEPTFSWRDDVLDAFIAYGIGIVASAGGLWLLGVLTVDTTLADAVGKVAVQTVPASIGAMLARSILSGEHADHDERPRESYGGELFIMTIGALFLAFSVAPTEEVFLLAGGLSPVRTIGVAVASLLLMHAFVYAIEFRGQVTRHETHRMTGEFVRLTVAGYVLAVIVSGYVLWTFGRGDGMHPVELLRGSIVLGFPAAIGAASARLIL